MTISGKIIAVFFDGTNNELGPENTNVVRLLQCMEQVNAPQLTFYDPGVGTLPEPGVFTKTGKWISKAWGLAFGRGISHNLAEAYEFLMNKYEYGDRVFIYGFSRGAYTARALAGILHQAGLLHPGNTNQIPYLIRLIKRCRGASENKRHRRSYFKTLKAFKLACCREIRPGAAEPFSVPVHFLGLWDTVSSVGWVWNPTLFPNTMQNPSVSMVRHAVSIDERRWFFRQNLWQKKEEHVHQDVRELWFPGVHSDVGGGYPEGDGALWRAPFLWMLKESVKAGLIINRQRLKAVLGRDRRRPVRSTPGWRAPAHESLRGAWYLAEFVPKKHSAGSGFRFGLFRRRIVPDGAMLHKSAIRRLLLGWTPGGSGVQGAVNTYNPPNISERYIRSLQKGRLPAEAQPYSP